MQISFLITALLTFALAQACEKCPHPGIFTGKLGRFTNPANAYCSLEGVPKDAIFASISADFYDPPDQSPCDAPINVTNPATKKTIEAIVVGKCKNCKSEGMYLTEKGFRQLSPNGRPSRAPVTVKWTFA